MILFRLSKILEDFHLTQKELSEKTGIRPATINNIYHGRTKRFTIEHLNKICETLDCTIEDVIEYIPDKVYAEIFNKYAKK
jgi:putative transcriptional regulator